MEKTEYASFFNAEGGMRTYKGTADENFFQGTFDMDQNNLQDYDPFIGGYAFIVWTKLPQFFDSAAKTDFKNMTEKNFKSLDGINDLQLESEAIGLGYAGNTYDAATTLKKPEGTFTLKHQEYMGSPIRKFYEYWITGIRDPETGVATYHGKIGTNEIPYYSARYHTAELLYVVTDPSGGIAAVSSTSQSGEAAGSDCVTNGIEFACYFTNVFPTKVPQAHLNYATGEHQVAEIDQEFKGTYHRSKTIDKLAVKAVQARKFLSSFREYKTDTEL